MGGFGVGLRLGCGFLEAGSESKKLFLKNIKEYKSKALPFLMIIVSFPRNECVRDHVERTLEIIKELEVDYSSTKSISLNFSEVKWFLPCSMILLSNKVRELMARGAGFVQYVRPINEKAREHMEKIGFPLGDKKDGGSYISIKHISRNQNKKDLVNERVNEMTSSLKELVPEEFGQSVIYILSEMSDNIDQHSNFQFASLMAQYFPQKGILDIAVFDNGLTIPGVYEKNNLKFKKDVDAIKMAVLDGKSTKEEKGRGFGLRSCGTLSLGVLEGEFHVISRNGILTLKSKEELEQDNLGKNSVGGTLIHFRLKKPKDQINIYEYVENVDVHKYIK